MECREIEGTFPLFVDEASAREREAAEERALPEKRRGVSLRTVLVLAGVVCAVLLLTVDLCLRLTMPPPPTYMVDKTPPKALIAPYVYMRTHPSTLIPNAETEPVNQAPRRPSRE